MGENKRESPPAVGGSSLLVVFAVLALTVFALLSLSTVQADVRLGDAAADSVRAYYEADLQAQEILARLRTGELPSGVETWPEGSWEPLWTGRYSYTLPISETQELQVDVLVNGLTGSYSIQRWQAASTGKWDADFSLELWDGGNLF